MIGNMMPNPAPASICESVHSQVGVSTRQTVIHPNPPAMIAHATKINVLYLPVRLIEMPATMASGNDGAVSGNDQIADCNGVRNLIAWK